MAGPAFAQAIPPKPMICSEIRRTGKPPQVSHRHPARNRACNDTADMRTPMRLIQRLTHATLMALSLMVPTLLIPLAAQAEPLRQS